jgi:hypothetical protein
MLKTEAKKVQKTNPLPFFKPAPHPILKQILQLKRPSLHSSTTDKVEELLRQHLGMADRDVDGNFIYRVGGNTKTAFMCHYDTAEQRMGFNKLKYNTMKPIVSVAGGGILGADCGAGMYLMIRMIQSRIPGFYAFFADEEESRLGSTEYRNREDAPRGCLRAIAFDRKGYSDVITHQFNQQGCSIAFAKALAAELNRYLVGYPPFAANAKGAYSDSYSFFDCIPECTNISVGYFDAHQGNEYLDFQFLEQLLTALLRINFNELPTRRSLKPLGDEDGILISPHD